MRYAPRDRSRVPYMKRLRDKMNGLLLEATDAQTKGVVYHPSVILSQLVEITSMLMEDEKNKALEPHHRDFLNFADKLAHFVENMEGIRLRAVSEEEIAKLNEMEPISIRRNPAGGLLAAPRSEFQPMRARVVPSILKRAAPRVMRIATPTEIEQAQSAGSTLSLSGYDALDCVGLRDIKEEEGLLMKEENICEVDTTPMIFDEPAMNPATTVPECRREIKEEMPDDFPIAGTSLNYEDIDDKFLPNPTLPPPTAVQVFAPSSETPLSLLGAAVKKATKRNGEPLDPIDASRLVNFMTPIRRTTIVRNPAITYLSGVKSSQRFVQATSKSVFAPGVPEPPKKLIKFSVSPSIGRTAPTTSHMASTSIQAQSASVPGRRMLECKACRKLMPERELSAHINAHHSSTILQKVVLVPPQSKKLTIPCGDAACDFECETNIEMAIHKEKIHGIKYTVWQKKGRFNLVQGTYCPFCVQPMLNLAELCRHIQWMHADRMANKLYIFSCSTCDSRFSRLHEVYEHWHLTDCLGGIRIAQNFKMNSLPTREMLASAADVITGPRGKTGF